MSKGLETIRQYKQFTCQYCQYHYDNQCNNEDECFSIIIDKRLKALEIIKKKGVNAGYFIHRVRENNLSYEEYVEEQETPYLDIYVSTKLLTKEEYELLKEVLL